MAVSPPDWTALCRTLPEWHGVRAALTGLLDTRCADHAHGDMPRWRAALARLPAVAARTLDCGATVTLSGALDAAGRCALIDALDALHPWRKGPFDLFGVHIDTEWRSDLKWQRLIGRLGRLDGQRILDVGCGNGYFGWRMLEAGAALVVGVDPTLLYCMQHRAITRYAGELQNWVLPLTFEELPPATFDTVFSMGVVYHRRDPAEHVRRLFDFLAPGGRVVLESLVITTGSDLVGARRYARMRNVHVVPAVTTLSRWLATAGFLEIELVDVTATTTAEQRTTPWMRFESLAAALDPANPGLTVEGHPAPVRAIVLGRKPG